MADDVVIQIRGNSANAEKALHDLRAELKQLDRAAQNVGKGSALSLQQGFANAFSVIGGGIATVTALGFAIDKALDFGEQGANITRLENSFQSLTAIAGQSGDELFSALDKAARGTVSNTELILSANRAMMLGLGSDAEQLSSLLEVAAFRGRAMGLSTTQAFNDIVTGVGRASPLILDNLGIVIDAEQTYQAYADSIGIAKGEMTKAQKTQALLTRVIEEGNRQMAEAGGLTDDTAASYERLNAQAKNYFDMLKKDAGEALAPVAEGLSQMFEIEQETQRLMKDGLNPYEARRQAIENITTAQDDATQSTEDFGDANEDTAESVIDNTEALKANEKALKMQSDAYKTLLSNMFKIQDANEKFIDDEEKRAEKQKDLEEDKVRVAIEAGEKQKDLKRDLAELDRDIANARKKEASTDEQRAAKAERIHDLNVRRQELLERIADAQQEAMVTQVEIDEKLAKLEEEKTEAIEDQSKARKQLVYDILEQKAAQDGLISSDEVKFLQDTAVQMGLVDRASADMAIAAAEAADIMWEQFQKPGEAVGDIQAALNRVVNGSPYTAQVVIEQVGGVPHLSAASQLRANNYRPSQVSTSLGYLGGFADGADFTVPPGFGNDSYFMGVSSGEHVSVTPAGESRTDGDKSVNVYVQNISDVGYIKLLAQEISKELT